MFILFIVDEIYHLASPASPVKYMYNPIKTIKTNTLGTLNMLGTRFVLHIYITHLVGIKCFNVCMRMM